MTLLHHLLFLGCLLIVGASVPRKIPYLEKLGFPKPERRFDECRIWGKQIPSHYNISLNVNVRGHNDAIVSTFHGVVVIDFKNNEEGATEIEIHSLNLTIDKVSVTHLNGNGEHEISAEVDRIVERKNSVILKLNGALTAGIEYKLKISYNGMAILNEEGLYETRDGENGTAVALVTQGEATHFRQWIPGFDEPLYKATFALKVTHPSTLKAYSNMPETRRTLSGKFATTEFEKTPLMSPYLLALAVNDYITREGEVNGYKVRVIMRKEVEEFIDSSLQKAIAALEFVLNLFNLPFMMEKYDFVYAFDFTAGAMENPGLIVMSEIKTKDIEYEVAAHELAHQYFGNLVTCSWWSNAWLNEGFADLYEVDSNTTSNAQRYHRNEFLQRDVDDLTYPLYAPDVTTTDEIDRLFTTIIYSKGGSVLRMIRETIGKEAFNTAIKKYLHLYSYSSASHIELIDMITSEVTAFDPRLFRELLKGWIEQNGYPILLVTRHADRVEIRQTRFHKGFTDESYRDEISRWSIPVFWKDDTSIHTDIFWSHEEVLVLPVSRESSFVVDPKGIGCYRVLYDDVKMYMNSPNRMDMLSDASYALKYGYMNATVAFSFLLEQPALDIENIFTPMNMLILSNTTVHPVNEKLQKFLTKGNQEMPSLRSMAFTSLKKISTYEHKNQQHRIFSSKGLHSIVKPPQVCQQKEINKKENPGDIERKWIFYAECYQNDFLNELSDEYLENVIAPALNNVLDEREKRHSDYPDY